MKIKIIGDRELWLVKEAEEFCLPVFVTPCVEDSEGEKKDWFCLVVPALMPTLPQYEFLQKHLAIKSVSKAKDRWLVPAQSINQVAERAPGVTPEFYYLWPGVNGEGEEEAKEEAFDVELQHDGKNPRTHESEAFLRYLLEETRVANINQLRAIWHVIQVYGAEWIYKRRKTLDLGFVRLDALPYRANWKQIMLARFPGIARFCKLTRPERNTKFAMLPEVAGFIRGSWMIGIDPSEWYANWVVEARATNAWRVYIANNERERLRQYSQRGYASWWRSQINKLESKIYDIFSDFVLDTAAPCAGIAKINDSSRSYLVPKAPKGRIRPQGEGDLPTAIVSPDVSVEMDDFGELGTVEFPTQSLPEQLPVIRPNIEDVRHAGRLLT